MIKQDRADNKRELVENLVNSLEKETERLRRQSETIKLRRDLASKDSKKPLASKTDEALRSEVEQYGGKLIYLDDSRLQAIKNRPQYYSLENISYEDLENMIATHQEQLEKLRKNYLSPRGIKDSFGEIPEGLTYEEVVRLRVTVKLKL